MPRLTSTGSSVSRNKRLSYVANKFNIFIASDSETIKSVTCLDFSQVRLEHNKPALIHESHLINRLLWEYLAGYLANYKIQQGKRHAGNHLKNAKQYFEDIMDLAKRNLGPNLEQSNEHCH